MQEVETLTTVFDAIGHVGIVVEDMEAAHRFFQQTLGLPVAYAKKTPRRHLVLYDFHGVIFEVMKITDSEWLHTHASYQQKGIHHWGFSFRTLGQAVKHLEAQGAVLNEEEADDFFSRRVFLSAADTKGVLTQMVAQDDYLPTPHPFLKRIDHLGIAVQDLDEAIARYQRLFGLKLDHVEDTVEKVAFFPLANGQIELLEGLPGSVIEKYVQKRGSEGIHHVAFEVDDLAPAIEHFKKAGVRFTTEAPTDGANQTKVIFMHPKDTAGVLFELVSYRP